MIPKQENHYKKMLQMQRTIEAADLFRKVLGKSETQTLEQKLKDPDSLESKARAAMIATVTTIQWVEMALAKVSAELRYIKETLDQDLRGQGDYHAHASHLNQHKEKQQIEKSVGIADLQERLATVKNELDELKNYRTQLDQQYEEAIDQFRNIHGQEIRATFESLNMAVNEEQLEQFHELNKQKAAPLLIDRIIASHEQATQQAQAAGAPLPPPLPPPEKVTARQQQVREVGWEAALLALMVDVYKNNPDPDRPESHLRAALKMLPLMKEVVNGQVGTLENLQQYFEEKRKELGIRIVEVKNQRDVLESEVYKFTFSLAPSMEPSFGSGQRQTKEDANEEAAVKAPSLKPKPY